MWHIFEASLVIIGEWSLLSLKGVSYTCYITWLFPSAYSYAQPEQHTQLTGNMSLILLATVLEEIIVHVPKLWAVHVTSSQALHTAQSLQQPWTALWPSPCLRQDSCRLMQSYNTHHRHGVVMIPAIQLYILHWAILVDPRRRMTFPTPSPGFQGTQSRTPSSTQHSPFCSSTTTLASSAPC